MELYLLLGCIGILLIICFYVYSKRGGMKELTEDSTLYPALERNIEYLESYKCNYEPNMRIKFHILTNKKKYNDMISTLEDKIYELNVLFNKLRYIIERTKFGEFLTASDIFKFIIEGKDIEECKKYIDTKIEIEKEIKDFKSRKKEIENLMQSLLNRSIEMKEKYRK